MIGFPADGSCRLLIVWSAKTRRLAYLILQAARSCKTRKEKKSNRGQSDYWDYDHCTVRTYTTVLVTDTT